MPPSTADPSSHRSSVPVLQYSHPLGPGFSRASNNAAKWSLFLGLAPLSLAPLLILMPWWLVWEDAAVMVLSGLGAIWLVCAASAVVCGVVGLARSSQCDERGVATAVVGLVLGMGQMALVILIVRAARSGV